MPAGRRPSAHGWEQTQSLLWTESCPCHPHAEVLTTALQNGTLFGNGVPTGDMDPHPGPTVLADRGIWTRGEMGGGGPREKMALWRQGGRPWGLGAGPGRGGTQPPEV